MHTLNFNIAMFFRGVIVRIDIDHSIGNIGGPAMDIEYRFIIECLGILRRKLVGLIAGVFAFAASDAIGGIYEDAESVFQGLGAFVL